MLVVNAERLTIDFVWKAIDGDEAIGVLVCVNEYSGNIRRVIDVEWEDIIRTGKRNVGNLFSGE